MGAGSHPLGSTSDSRWHESGHGTAFKTDWMNNVLYEIASFMVMRESTPWRWSHTRHHSDTIIVGRDPEIAVPRPPSIPILILNFFGLKVIPLYLWRVLLHCTGWLTPEETGLSCRRRLGVCPPSQARRQGHGHWSVRRVPHQTRQRGNGLRGRRLRHGPAALAPVASV